MRMRKIVRKKETERKKGRRDMEKKKDGEKEVKW